MNKRSTLLGLSLTTFMLAGCTTTQVDTSIGGAAGAGLGYAVSGSPWGAVIGGGAGALIGNQIGQEQTRRNHYRNGQYYYY